ncbi:hypothetical protein Pelo_362 [Pelomyxa schiedti]|nr:hypothetical protein Pelo_362 [Pelomyxa schiedti]
MKKHIHGVHASVTGTLMCTPQGSLLGFVIDLRSGGVTFRAVKLYHELHTMHDMLAAVTVGLPKFPPLTADLSSPPAVVKSGDHMLYYLRALLKLPSVLGCEILHQTLQLSPEMKCAMMEYGRGLIIVKEREKDLQRQEETLKIAQADYVQAQNFHLVATGKSPPVMDEANRNLLLPKSDSPPVTASPPTTVNSYNTIPALFFTHSLRFVIPVDFWETRPIIQDTLSRDWFALSQTKIHPFSINLQLYSLNNMSGIPLIWLAFNTGTPLVSVSIYEGLADKSLINPYLTSPLCCVTKQIAEKHGPAIYTVAAPNKPPVTCSGLWALGFRIHEHTRAGEVMAVMVTRHEGTDSPFAFNFDVAAHKDILFYLAIGAAIDRLHSGVRGL